MISSFEREMLAGISGERAYQYVAQLIELTNRTAGSKAEAEGANKVKEMLSPFVDECELEGVPVTTYFKRQGQLEVVSPSKLVIPCEAAPLSGSGRGEAVLLDVGDGTKEAYERLGVAVQSAALLATTPRPTVAATFETRIGMCLEARNRGAKCFIFHIPQSDDELIAQFVMNVEFPTFIISNHSASELRKLLSQHKEVRVKFESFLEQADATTYNVVGTITGSQYPEEVIYLTSHHDTWYYGANDNNASTACLLEVARIFNRHRPRHTIRLVVFGSEESGASAGAVIPAALQGSYGYSERHRAELERISGGKYTLCDINGEILGYTSRAQVMCSPEMVPVCMQVAQDLGGYARVEEPPPQWFWSDHLCFHTLGIPAVSMGPASDLGTNRRSSFFNIYHTGHDNMDAINPTALAMNSSFIALLAYRMDLTEVPPYSLEVLASAAVRSLEWLPNMDRVAALLRQKVENCYRAKNREERMTRILKLVSVVNREIYGFVVWTLPVHKFDFISDFIGKLRDARSIIEVDGDFDRAREVLRTIGAATLYDDFTSEVVTEIDGMENASGLTSRFSRCWIDLRDIFRALRERETPEKIVPRIEAISQQAIKMATDWGVQYEQALQSL